MNKKYRPAVMVLSTQQLEPRRVELVLLGSVLTPESAGTSQLALRELEEANHWARLGAKIYFCWFVLMLVFNGLGMSWLFTRNGGIPDFARVIFVFFILLNLASAFVVFYVRSYLLDSSKRMDKVLGAAARQNGNGNGREAQSPLPVLAVNVVFYFSLTALFMLILFWVYLMGWGMALISRAAG